MKKAPNLAPHLTATGIGTAYGAETAMNMAIDQVGQGFVADQLVGPLAGVAGGVAGSAVGSLIYQSLPTFDTTVDTVIAATGELCPTRATRVIAATGGTMRSSMDGLHQGQLVNELNNQKSLLQLESQARQVAEQQATAATTVAGDLSRKL